jgi:hypothetical protein
MKKIILGLIVCSAIIACKDNDKKIQRATPFYEDSLRKAALGDTANYTSIQWLDSTYLDLGKQKEGKEIEVTFRFRNTGNKNLIIENVHAPCGCTVPEKPEKPFAPGEEGLIKAKFNGSGHGQIRKDIAVTANTSPNMHTLTFGAEMIK